MIYLYKQCIDPKLRLLELAKELGNVSEACKIMGYSRDSYYRFKAIYDDGGEAALLALNSRRSNIKNRLPDLIEEAVLKLTFEKPIFGQLPIARTLLLQGITISPGGVRNIWVRNGLETVTKRLAALAKRVAEGDIEPTEEQRHFLDSHGEKGELKEKLATEYPGYLLSQDSFFIGSVAGIGELYQQTIIDTYSEMVFVRLYVEKSADVAVDLLKWRVIPWFECHSIQIDNILTDRGREYGVKGGENNYQRFLSQRCIVHHRSEDRNPQANSVCEKFHEIIMQEVYRNIFSRNAPITLKLLQEIVDHWLRKYNEQRLHYGRHCKGKSPFQAFLAGKKIARIKQEPEFRTT